MNFWRDLEETPRLAVLAFDSITDTSTGKVLTFGSSAGSNKRRRLSGSGAPLSSAVGAAGSSSSSSSAIASLVGHQQDMQQQQASVQHSTRSASPRVNDFSRSSWYNLGLEGYHDPPNNYTINHEIAPLFPMGDIQAANHTQAVYDDDSGMASLLSLYRESNPRVIDGL